MKKRVCLAGLFSVLTACSGAGFLNESAPGAAVARQGDCAQPASAAYATVCALGRGVNLGNVLDAPKEGAWGITLRDDLFDGMHEAGFTTMRLPVRWSNHAAATAPYTIDEAFFQRVDYAVDAALKRGMYVVLNMHHYRQLDGDKLDSGEFAVADNVLEDRAVAIWQQVAQRYQHKSPKLLFELYNEPHGRQTADRWNTLSARLLAAVRQSNPDRMVVIGPVRWNSAQALPELKLPADPNLIATIHSYEPFNFTHQGAEWVSGASAWLGNTCCTGQQKVQMDKPLNIAVQWSGGHHVPVWVGEFGAYSKAPEASRLAYTRYMRDAMEQRGLSWAYWEFASGFGMYHPQTRQWNIPLRDALTGR